MLLLDIRNVENTIEYVIDEIIEQLDTIFKDVLVVEQKSSKKNHINSKPLFTKVFQKAHTKYHNSKLYYYRKRT